MKRVDIVFPGVPCCFMTFPPCRHGETARMAALSAVKNKKAAKMREGIEDLAVRCGSKGPGAGISVGQIDIQNISVGQKKIQNISVGQI